VTLVASTLVSEVVVELVRAAVGVVVEDVGMLVKERSRGTDGEATVVVVASGTLGVVVVIVVAASEVALDHDPMCHASVPCSKQHRRAALQKMPRKQR